VNARDREAWRAMSTGRDDLYGLDLGRSAGRDTEPRRGLLGRALDGAVVLGLALAVAAASVLAGREQDWTNE
jgi:hypothetical protein